ncbi:sialin-like [Rhodnius prolixus]|uniref:sialin-like n=1 Tax=Rhodnius prolixus TaxID=13249 RepID=UPI003D189A73
MPLNLLTERHFVAILCCMGLTISYTMRVCLSLAITEMAKPTFVKEDPQACPYPLTTIKIESNTTYQYEWTEQKQGLILSSFFWGYVFTLIPGALLAESKGPKVVLINGVGLTSIFTLFTPVLLSTWGWQGLILSRIAIGLAQGLTYAALHTSVAHWIPQQERSTWATVVFSGSHVGNMISMICTSMLLSNFKGRWDVVFYLYGSLGLLWTLIFSCTTHSRPQDHPRLSEEEKLLLQKYLQEVSKREANKSTPWRSILRSRPVWAIIIAMIGHDWSLYALISDVPKYFKSVLHLTISQNGDYMATGFFLMWLVSIVCGVLADYINRRKLVSITANRKIMTTLASLGPVVGLLGASYSGCNIHTAVICLVIGMGFMGAFYPSLKVNPIDLAPNYGGTLGALGQTVGGFSGITVPFLTGILTPNAMLIEWRTTFWLTFVVTMLTTIYYLLNASAELQKWNTESEEDPLFKGKQ